MHFDSTDLSLGDLVDGLDEYWGGVATAGGTGSQGLRSGTVLTLDPVVQIIDPDTGDTVSTETITGTHTWTGNGTAEPLPPATAMLVEWRTGTYVGGREVRGRTFFSSMTEDSSVSGVPGGAMFTALGSMSNTLALESMLVYSPTKHVRAPVQSATVWSKFAVLRSRRD
jgi:hypothetical protein